MHSPQRSLSARKANSNRYLSRSLYYTDTGFIFPNLIRGAYHDKGGPIVRMPVAGVTAANFSLRPRQRLGSSGIKQVPVKPDHEKPRGFVVP